MLWLVCTALAEEPPPSEAPEAPPAEAPPPPPEAPPAEAPPPPPEAPSTGEEEEPPETLAIPPDLGDPVPPDPSALRAVTLSDGQVVVGVPLRVGTGWQLVLKDGRWIALPLDAISHVAASAVPEPPPPADLWESDPNRTRYFYAPSAFPLGAGRGYVSQKELAFTAGAIGVTGFWDVQVGTVLPLLFTESPVAILGSKVGVRVAPWLHVGAGGQAAIVPEAVLGIAFVNATVGDEHRNLTLGGGASVDLGNQTWGPSPVVLAGRYRLGPRVALLSENWLLIDDDLTDSGLMFVPAFGLRLFGQQFAVDLGIVGIGPPAFDFPLPLPWVDFTYNFDVARKRRKGGDPPS